MNRVARSDAKDPVPLDIVFVDDDQLTLDNVAWNLRHTKTSHRLFTDPETAMTHLYESMPQILVVDYFMPTLNGIDFLSQLKASVSLNGCSVYLCSAVSPRPAELEQIKALGAGVLDKSEICDRSALLALIESQQCLTGNT